MEDISIRVAGEKKVPNPMGFTDDIYDVCKECGKAVMMRPDGPMPPEVEINCLDCAMPKMVASHNRGELELHEVGEKPLPFLKALLEATVAAHADDQLTKEKKHEQS